MDARHAPDTLRVCEEQRGASVVLRITGDLDAASAVAFARRVRDLVDHGARFFVFDCRDLNYIASAGLGVFVSHKDEVYAAGGRFTFFGLRPKVADVFRMLGLTAFFTFVDTESEALAQAA
jgi:anti-sigma B factor antagonist